MSGGGIFARIFGSSEPTKKPHIIDGETAMAMYKASKLIGPIKTFVEQNTNSENTELKSKAETYITEIEKIKTKHENDTLDSGEKFMLYRLNEMGDKIIKDITSLPNDGV